MAAALRVGFGCMRLSTEPSVTEPRAIRVLHAALDAGARLLDTADVYAPDAASLGHNERLIQKALKTWNGPSDIVRVATKGGLCRPARAGRWIPNGRAKHLKAACEESRRNLDREVIDLYLLHAPDPKTPLKTSIRALAQLKNAGRIAKIGLSNVTCQQIREAQSVSPIDTVEIALGPREAENFRNGVAELCAAEGIELIAHSPYGGRRTSPLTKIRGLQALATELGVSCRAVVLRWLMGLSPRCIPVPGTVSEDHVRPLAEALELNLSDARWAKLDTIFPLGRLVRVARGTRKPRAGAEGDVRLIMGRPGAGKSTLAEPLIEAGYERLNRDTLGGRLSDLIPRLDRLLLEGHRRVVLDNTYGRRSARNEVIECAWKHGLPVRCTFVATSLEDAQIHVADRLLRRYGRLLEPEELSTFARTDPAVLDPNALFRFERAFEPPDPSEGFEELERVTLPARPVDPRARPAVLFDLRIPPDALPLLRKHATDDTVLAAFAWEPGIVPHPLLEDWRRRLGTDIPLAHCGHPAGAPLCWCRPPLPGLPLLLASRMQVDLRASILIGGAVAHRTLARRLRMKYVNPANGDGAFQDP